MGAWHDMLKRHQQEKIDLLESLKHKTLREVSGDIGLPEQSVSYFMNSLGIERESHRKGRAARSKRSKKIMTLFEKGYSAQKIARIAGESVRTVSGVIYRERSKDHGLL